MAHKLSSAPDVEEREDLLPAENIVSSSDMPNDKQLFSELCKNETRNHLLEEFEPVKNEVNSVDGTSKTWLRRFLSRYGSTLWLLFVFLVSDYVFTDSLLKLKITGCDDMREDRDDVCNIYGQTSLCECFSSNFAACHGGIFWKTHTERWDFVHWVFAITALSVWFFTFGCAIYLYFESLRHQHATIRLLLHRVLVETPTYWEVFRHNWKFVALCSMAASSVALRVFLGCLQESYHYVRHPGDHHDLCEHEVNVMVYYTSHFKADQLLAKDGVGAVFVAVAPLVITGVLLWLRFFNEVMELCRFSYKEITPSLFLQLEEKALVRVRWETMKRALSQSLLPGQTEEEFRQWLPEFISTLREVAYVQFVKGDGRYQEKYKWRHRIGEFSRLTACISFFGMCLFGAVITVLSSHHTDSRPSVSDTHYMAAIALVTVSSVCGIIAVAASIFEWIVVREMRHEAKAKIEKRFFGELDNV